MGQRKNKAEKVSKINQVCRTFSYMFHFKLACVCAFVQNITLKNVNLHN